MGTGKSQHAFQVELATLISWNTKLFPSSCRPELLPVLEGSQIL